MIPKMQPVTVMIQINCWAVCLTKFDITRAGIRTVVIYEQKWGKMLS